MPPRRRRSPARLLAPIALIAFAFAFYVVLNDSSVTGDENGSGATTAEPTASERATPAPKPKRKPATYTVKAGDSLGAIAEKAGLDVEKLQELNPEVDAQALSPGQKLKLRE